MRGGGGGVRLGKTRRRVEGSNLVLNSRVGS